MNRISEVEIQYQVYNLAKKIAKSYSKLTIISILDGAFMFTSDLIKQLHVQGVEVELYFIKMSSYENNTISRGDVGVMWDGIKGDLNNKNVMIVDDIIDTGNTLSYLIDYIMKNFASPKSITTCVLLDKPAGRTVELFPTYAAFQIEDHFVHGYGMDNKEGMKRELPYITWDI